MAISRTVSGNESKLPAKEAAYLNKIKGLEPEL
jgi:hypothetical protein